MWPLLSASAWLLVLLLCPHLLVLLVSFMNHLPPDYENISSEALQFEAVSGSNSLVFSNFSENCTELKPFIYELLNSFACFEENDLLNNLEESCLQLLNQTTETPVKE